MFFGDGVAAYDATADRWEVLIDPADRDPSDWPPSSMVYDPVNWRLVGLGRGVVVDQGGVVAFDTMTRESDTCRARAEVPAYADPLNRSAGPRGRPEGDGLDI